MSFKAISQWWDDFNKPTYVVTEPGKSTNHGRPLYHESKRSGSEAGRAHLTLYSDGSYKAGVGGKGGYGECKLKDFEAYPSPLVWQRTYAQRNRHVVEDVFFLTWATVHKGKDGRRELRIHQGKLPSELKAEFGQQIDARFFQEKPSQPVDPGFQRRCLTVTRDRY